MKQRRTQKTAESTEQVRMSSGSIILHELARRGVVTFRQILMSATVRTHGAHLSENSFYTALARLRKRHMVDKDSHGYVLTPRGEWEAVKAAVRVHLVLAAHAEGNEKTWDGKWRIILFDFPEKKRPYRDYFRLTLKRSGFNEFQRSTWISPRPFPGYLRELVRMPQLEKHVRLITVQDINYDKDLRRRFKLA